MKSYPSIRAGLIVLIVVALLLLTAAPQSAHAAGPIVVTSAADSVGSDGLCTLREAITNANNDAATYGDCAAGSGADTITFAPALAGTLISLNTVGDTTLGPAAFGVTSNVTILGDANQGITIERNNTAPWMRIFYVGTGGTLTLKYLTLQGGMVLGSQGGAAMNGGSGGASAGMGGAIFNQGILYLDSVTLRDNQAVGGTGGAWIIEAEAYNGGGGGGVNSSGNLADIEDSAGGGPNGGSVSTPTNDATGPGGGGGGAIFLGWDSTDPHRHAGRGGDFGGGGGGHELRNGGLGGFGGGGGGGGATPGIAAMGEGGLSVYGGGAGGRGGSYMFNEMLHASGAGGGGAGMGGALFNDRGGSVTIVNSTLVANMAQGGPGGPNYYPAGGSVSPYSGSGGSALGGGIFNRSGTLTLVNVTLANNNVIAGIAGPIMEAALPGNPGARNGSELYTMRDPVTGEAAAVNMVNTIVVNSSAVYDHLVNDPGYAGTVTGSHNLVMRASGIPAGIILSTADPLLGPLGDNGGPTQTFALNIGSPAINAGTSGAPVLDQRGAGRDEMPDIGAYEVESIEWIVDSAADIIATDGLTTLREAIQRASGSVGPHTIRFAPGMAGQTITFSAAAEDDTFGPSAFRVDYPITIDAAGVEGIVIQRSTAAPEMRLFYVAPGGSLTLEGLTLTNGVARGGDGGSAMGGGGGGAAGLGGAIFNQGTLILEGVTLTDHQAIGGNGTAGGYCGGGGGGGGGGMGSDGTATGGMNGGAGGGPNGGDGGQPGPQNNGAAGGVGGGGGGGMSWSYYDGYAGYNGGAGGFGGAGGGGGCGTSFYQKGVGGAGGFGGGAGGNSPGMGNWVYGGFGGGDNGTFASGGGGAGMGGAVFNHGGALTIVNSTLSGNTAQGGASYFSGSGLGGAVFNRAGTVTILNSTLAYNIVSTSGLGTADGGALYSYADGGAATVNVTNSILSNSTGGSDAVNDGGAVSGSHNVIMSESGFGGVTLSSDNPNLGALADNGGGALTHAIEPPSPALHSGTAVGAPATDQRSIPRDTRPDIGSFELQASITFADPAGVCDGNIPCFTTMGGAIGGALSGGMAVIYPAAYNENVLLNKAITVQVNGNLALNGSLTMSAGVFNAGSGNVTVNGDFTLSGGSFTAPGGLLDVTGATVYSGGTFTYTPNGAIREQRSVSGTPALTFPLTGVTIAVTANTDLTGVQVTRHEQNHVGATTPATQTGRYWSLTPTGSDFTVNLTLPASFTPDAADKLCRYTAGPGYGWNCGYPEDHTFTGNTVTRYGVNEFSDWVVGNNAGPTAVSLQSFSAASPVGWVGWLVGLVGLLGVFGVLGATAVVRRHRQKCGIAANQP